MNENRSHRRTFMPIKNEANLHASNNLKRQFFYDSRSEIQWHMCTGACKEFHVITMNDIFGDEKWS